MTLSEKFSNSWSLFKTALVYIRRDPELFWYGFLSFLISTIIFVVIIVVSFPFLVASFESELVSEAYQEYIFLWIGFVYYLVFSLVKYFFEAAIISSIERRLEGKDNSFGDWINSAVDKIGKIFVWSIVESTVFTIINFIQKWFGENSIIWKIIAKFLGWAWSILTYFSFPLLILSEKNIKESINESGSIFKKTWWENAILYVSTGFVFGLIYFAIIGLGFVTFLSLIQLQDFVIPMIITFVLMMICFVFLGILKWITESIIRVLLLYYAISGKTPEFLETTDIARIKNESLK